MTISFPKGSRVILTSKLCPETKVPPIVPAGGMSNSILEQYAAMRTAWNGKNPLPSSMKAELGRVKGRDGWGL